MSAAASAFFAALWLLRRRETAYGWFALMSVLWLLFGYNQIATSPSALASNHSWQALNISTLLVFGVSYVVFALRFCGRRMPRLEGAALLVRWSACSTCGGAPRRPDRAPRHLDAGGRLIVIAVNGTSIIHALRHRTARCARSRRSWRCRR